MCRIEALVQMMACADGDDERTEEIVQAIEKAQDEQRQAFERDRPQIMDEMQRKRRERMAVIHRKGEDIAIAH